MASQTTGIQQLLAAEKRAAEKVAEARKRKNRRLKQAKEEAQAEIETYRQERERQFLEHQEKHMGSRTDIVRRMDEQTLQKMDELNQNVSQNKDEVMARILELVYDIRPELHQNLKVN
ncbi:V-type proton ATPase subunit G-like [Branchiostoma floridae]|uniref:V-type proton ATPase subunit G n=1 Tax=Branchiostoma floridae TaxID=7739 RepID=C3Z577_BRAFL|nr:V-type proton ATPase subunit G-like [Branchiostoma floridae]|eukprot:XP_002596422.1 hypothetical protein BRAFLDRAFT_263848 [Branchiostoma floridae]